MLLQRLVDIIDQLKERLTVHGTDLRSNETRTRMALIDPMLAVLGWDPADPSLVMPEYEVRRNRADYALLGPGGQPVALLEAKKLGESLTAHREQMVTYGNMGGTPYAGLTDGNHWELYSVFERKPIEERLILKASISDDSIDKIAVRLLALWYPHLASGAVELPKESILEESTSTWVSTPKDSEFRSVFEVARQPDLPAESAKWKTLDNLDKVANTPPPSRIRMPDGSEYSIRRWKDILTLVARWLYERGHLVGANNSIPISKNRYLVNSVPDHRNGKPFREARQIADEPLYVETHWSAADIVRHTRTLAEKFGVNVRNIALHTS